MRRHIAAARVRREQALTPEGTSPVRGKRTGSRKGNP